jgi:hypothetical protein
MTDQNFICCDCIEDPYLNLQMVENAEVEVCSYCSESNIGQYLNVVANVVDLIYRQYFGYGETYPTFHGDSDKPDYEQRGDYPEYIINMMVKPSDSQVSDDICSFLAEDEGYSVVKDGADSMYDSTSCYQHIDTGAGYHNELWEKFCEEIKHGARFFSFEAKTTLSEVFKNINNFSTTLGKKPISEISGRKIYRGRKANTQNEIKKITSDPAIELAAPPSHLARNGRMNPVGISVFYGAFDKETCIAELRPAVGETVVCGLFKEYKPLRVMDFTVLNQVYDELSMFDPEYFTKLSQIQFLRSFESIISKAFLPSSTELEYLPLQAMTEYLSRFVEGGLDGAIYPSAQRGGKTENIIIFDSSNKVIEKDEFISYEKCSVPNVTLVDRSITIHKVNAVEYTQSEESLESFMTDLECGRCDY